MYISRNVKCADCGNVFKIEYDSRKEKQDIYTCKCGHLKCYANVFGIFCKNPDGMDEKLTDTETEDFSYNYDEDYIKLSDESISLLSDIDHLGNLLNRKMNIHYYNYTNKEHISLELKGGSEKEDIKIKANVNLLNKYGWKHGKEEQEKRVIEALSRFKNILTEINNGNLDLSKPRKIWTNTNCEWHNRMQVQKELYNYQLTC